MLPETLLIGIDSRLRESVNRCWATLRSEPPFKQVAKGHWKVDFVEVKPADEVVKDYGCSEHPSPAVRRLPEALEGVRLCCLIEIANDDRTGLEHLPRHVLGSTGTFFLDLDSADLKHCIIGVHSS